MPTSSRDDARDLEKEWRENTTNTIRDVQQQTKEIAKLVQDTALTLASISTRVTVLEGKPAEQRAQSSTASQSIVIGISCGSFLFTIIAFLATHISFH